MTCKDCLKYRRCLENGREYPCRTFKKKDENYIQKTRKENNKNGRC